MDYIDRERVQEDAYGHGADYISQGY